MSKKLTLVHLVETDSFPPVCSCCRKFIATTDVYMLNEENYDNISTYGYGGNFISCTEAMKAIREAAARKKEELDKSCLASSGITSTPTFQDWGSFELDEYTIQSFLDSKAGPEACMTFTKGEMEDFLEGYKKKYVPEFMQINSKLEKGKEE